MSFSHTEKKPTISHFEFLIQAVAKPGKLQLVYHRDHLWMMSTALCQNIPMWVGWNSLITDDPLPQQIIGYMNLFWLLLCMYSISRAFLKRSTCIATAKRVCSLLQRLKCLPLMKPSSDPEARTPVSTSVSGPPDFAKKNPMPAKICQHSVKSSKTNEDIIILGCIFILYF